jgi:hypothetical protein
MFWKNAFENIRIDSTDVGRYISNNTEARDVKCNRGCSSGPLYLPSAFCHDAVDPTNSTVFHSHVPFLGPCTYRYFCWHMKESRHVFVCNVNTTRSQNFK